MMIGYARVSTGGQSLALQISELQGAGVERIFQEKASGAKADRAELARMFDQLRAGDVVIVTKLDRFGRSTVDLLENAARLNDIDVGFKSLAEPWADTTTPAGRMVLTVMAGVAQFERERILERTGEGRAVAKAAGVKFGRPASLTADQVAHARALLAEPGAKLRAVARMIGTNHTTLGRALAVPA